MTGVKSRHGYQDYLGLLIERNQYFNIHVDTTNRNKVLKQLK